jgi:hypothetical protein
LVADVKEHFLAAGACDLNGSNKDGKDVESKTEHRRKVETEMARRWRE